MVNCLDEVEGNVREVGESEREEEEEREEKERREVAEEGEGGNRLLELMDNVAEKSKDGDEARAAIDPFFFLLLGELCEPVVAWHQIKDRRLTTLTFFFLFPLALTRRPLISRVI